MTSLPKSTDIELPRFPFFMLSLAFIAVILLSCSVVFISIGFNELNYAFLYKIRWVLYGIMIAILITFVTICALIYRNIKKWKIALDNKIAQQLEYESNLEDLQNFLEERMQVRTAELVNKNKQLNDSLNALRKTQKTLIQSEKMATVGHLAAGAAHQINNPLTFLLTNMEILQRRVLVLDKYFHLNDDLFNEVKSSKQKNVQTIKNEITELNSKNDINYLMTDSLAIIKESNDGLIRIKNIVTSLESFSGRNNEVKSLSDVNAILESSLDMVASILNKKCQVQKTLGQLPPYQVYPNQLKLLFVNLLLNAADCIKTQGNITLISSATESEIAVSVKDDGCGIPSEDVYKIFDPFFTTKPIGLGVGLGLFTAYGIAKSHNGNITVESQIGKGSTFTLILPRGEVTDDNKKSASP